MVSEVRAHYPIACTDEHVPSAADELHAVDEGGREQRHLRHQGQEPESKITFFFIIIFFLNSRAIKRRGGVMGRLLKKKL